MCCIRHPYSLTHLACLCLLAGVLALGGGREGGREGSPLSGQRAAGQRVGRASNWWQNRVIEHEQANETRYSQAGQLRILILQQR